MKGAGTMAAKGAAKNAAGTGAKALTGAPGGGAPAGSLPAGAGGGSPAGSLPAGAAGSQPAAAELPAPTTTGMQAQAPLDVSESPAGGEPPTSPSVHTSRGQAVSEPMSPPDPPDPPAPSRRNNSLGAERNEAAASHQDRLRHVPPGRHGNMRVHRNGQVSSSRTLTESGESVWTVPSDDRLSRAWKSGDSWVVSDAGPEGAVTTPKPPPMQRPRRQSE